MLTEHRREVERRIVVLRIKTEGEAAPTSHIKAKHEVEQRGCRTASLYIITFPALAVFVCVPAKLNEINKTKVAHD